MDYSRAEANPPHTYIKVKAVAHEVWLVRLGRRLKGKKMPIIRIGGFFENGIGSFYE